MNNYSDRLLNSAKKMHEKRYSSFVVCHNQQSYDYFKTNNSHLDLSDFKFIQVGHQPRINNDVIYALDYINNLENFKSLLTFTAWHLIEQYDLIESEFDYVGIYEYDVKFSDYPNNLILEYDKIIGFNKRNIPDSMYLDCVPPLKKCFSNSDLNKILSKSFWNSTSNFIIPYEFLCEFNVWFKGIIFSLLNEKNHSHYHERAINVFAALYRYRNEYSEILQHAQLNSHKQPL